MTVNLAEKTQQERELMQADFLACQIRQETNGMGLFERKRYAGQKLDRMPEQKRAMVIAALTKRAGK